METTDIYTIHDNIKLSVECKKSISPHPLVVNSMSMDNEVHQKRGYFNNGRLKKRMYTLYARIDSMHECKNASQMLWKADHKKELSKQIISKAINDLRSYFDISDDSEPIDHTEWTNIDIDILRPEIARNELKKVLNRHIHGKWSIFGLERGYEGTWHFHVMSQGYIDNYRKVGYRSGWGYHKEPNDRKPLQDFKNTVKYCLCKINLNKKAYIKRN